MIATSASSWATPEFCQFGLEHSEVAGGGLVLLRPRHLRLDLRYLVQDRRHLAAADSGTFSTNV